MSTDVTGDRTLAALLGQWAGARPSHPVLVSHQETISWERLATEVDALRRRLAGAGVTHGVTVAVALPNSPLAIALWLAVPANGAIVQVLDPGSGALAVERALLATGPRLVITTEAGAPLYRDAVVRTGAAARLVVVEDTTALRLPALGRPATPSDASADQVAALLPTSGTSGAPKLVELTHRTFVTSAERLARNGGYLPSDRHYLCSPLFHTNAQAYLCAPPFVTGGSIALVPRFSASRWFDDARELGATVASMVAPPMRMALHRALERGGTVDPGPLRAVHYGMTLSVKDWQDWDRLVPQVHMRQIYGQTESVTGVLGGAPWEADDRVTIGRPFLGVDRVKLVRPDGAEAADGEPGELWVRGEPGHTLMRGYHNAPAATAETLVDGRWLRTGDQLVRHPSGRFEFRGRAMHIIRRGGENLSTYTLETDLRSCPLITDVAVAAQDDDTLDTVVVAHVIPRPEFTEAGFLRWCRDNAGKRGTPDVVRTHAEFPRTGSGRVILRDLA
ncbi:class I adenylate-forming enzyme family protein [Amycolatopsis saalfeldensis]|uniref:Crotonobetaine/carnitine-CoA ligase n=1 Tax=Amycolatopsis saalfeldensis TaxID=394193 RepID=A0A1H8U523_9PSEU|nr:class I adenylate-forming enzyme family protein [Amycolatopsis saalfeldensis]SEO98255.1 crotonobetaine/carnitine-CoA ligase [Amycolatopsis saalfeldensis]